MFRCIVIVNCILARNASGWSLNTGPITRLMLFAFTFLLPLLLPSQHPTFRHFTVDDGLASSTVYEVFEDSKGFLWFGTDKGVSRYDGYSFQNFTVDDGLYDNEVFRFHEDSKGRIWLFNYSAKMVFYKDGVFHNPSNDPILAQFPDTNRYYGAFLEDSRGNLWFSSMDGALVVLDGERVVLLDRVDGLRLKAVAYMSEGTSGKINVFAVLTLPAQINGKNSRMVTAQLSYAGGKIVAQVTGGYENERVCTYCFLDGQSDTLLMWGRKVLNFPMNGEPPVERNWGEDLKQFYESSFSDFTWLSRDGANNLWLGSYYGVFFFENGNSWQHSTMRLFPDAVVTSVLHDREGGYWFSMHEQGAYYTPSIDVLTWGTQEGFPSEKMFSVEKRGTDEVWVGMEAGDYSVLKNEKEVFNYKVDSCAGNIGRNLDLLEDPATGNMVISGDCGVFMHSDSKPCLVNSPIRTISRHGNGFWATARRGVLELHSDQPVTRQYIDALGRFFYYRFENGNGMVDMANGQPLLAGMHGLFIGNPTDSTIAPYPIDHPMLRKRISDLKTDGRGWVWLASDGHGIAVIRENEIRVLSEKDGIPSEIVSGIFVDSEDHVWLSSNKGICKIQVDPDATEPFQIHSFSTHQGLASDEVRDLDRIGNRVFVGTGKGLSVFDESLMFERTVAPPVIIQGFELGDQDTLVADNYQIPFSDRRVKIEYTGLSYKSRGKLSYRYRLEGLDSTWRMTDSRTATFPGLAPGEYKFVVFSRTFDGVESLEPATIAFTVLKPWWQTWWFYSICIFITAMTVSAISYARIQSIRRKNEFDLRVSEFRHQALSAQMNPHFIFNALNSIHYFISENDLRSAHDYLSQFGRLVRGILDYSSKSSIPLSREIDLLKGYLLLESLRMADKFAFKIELEADLELDMVELPPMFIQPLVENAIQHGIRNKDDKGTVKIQLSQRGNLLVCIVEDDGVGRKKAQEIDKNRKLERKSLSISVIRERLAALDRMGKKGGKLSYTDLKNDDGSAAGTRVELLIPIT